MAPGRAYTIEEKRQILQYMVQHDTFRGVNLWKNMERDFCQRRSWQSLREHFRKQLHPNLKDSSLGLTPAEIKKFPVYVGKPSGARANGASGSSVEMEPAKDDPVYVHPDVIEKIKRAIEEKGITDYTLAFQPGSAKGDYSGRIIKAKIEGVYATGTKATLNWIFKCALTAEHVRQMVQAEKFYKREMYIYETVLPTFAAFRAEKLVVKPFDDVPVFVGCLNEPLKETVIMEDMKSVGYVMKDRKLPFDLHHVRLAVKAYARFHAVSYALKDQRADEFKRIAEASKDFLINNPDFKQFSTFQNGLNELILSSFDRVKDAHIVEKFKKYNENLYDTIVKTIRLSEDSPNCVITHGDCWINHMLFLYGDKDHPEIPTKICILDWQNARCGSPAFDISFFFFTCTDKAFRDLHYHHMTKLYYYTLCANLVDLGSDPETCLPYDVFQNELKRYSILGISISIILLNMMLSDVDEIPDSMLENLDNLENYKTKKNEGEYKKRIRGVVENAVHYGYFDFLQ